MLEHIGRYARAGVRVGIGTDTVPHNMLEEMRWATVLGKISAEDISAVTMEEVLHAATVGGATALVRDDIGRLAPGKKADLVLVDLQHPLMKPRRDPLRSLIFHGADRCIRDVYVDGIRVVEGGTVLTLDYEGAVDRVEEAQRRMIDATPVAGLHRAKRRRHRPAQHPHGRRRVAPPPVAKGNRAQETKPGLLRQSCSAA